MIKQFQIKRDFDAELSKLFDVVYSKPLKLWVQNNIWFYWTSL